MEKSISDLPHDFLLIYFRCDVIHMFQYTHNNDVNLFFPCFVLEIRGTLWLNSVRRISYTQPAIVCTAWTASTRLTSLLKCQNDGHENKPRLASMHSSEVRWTPEKSSENIIIWYKIHNSNTSYCWRIYVLMLMKSLPLCHVWSLSVVRNRWI